MERALLLVLRVRRVCILLLRAGRGMGYGDDRGTPDSRAPAEEAARRGGEVEPEAASATGCSAVSMASACSPASGWSWLMLISRLKRNSPLLGFVRLTARHVWLPLCPLRVAFPVRRNVFSHSSNESPLDASAPGSTLPGGGGKHADDFRVD